MGAPAVSPATKVMHDLAVGSMPEGSKHHCFICDIAEPEATDVSAEDLQAAVDTAVSAALDAPTKRIQELEDQLAERDAESATAQAVADAIAPFEEKVKKLTDDLDEALAARKTAEDQVKSMTDQLEEGKAEQAKTERRSSRVAAVKDTGVFPDDAFDEAVDSNKDRIDRWSEMEDSVFDALVEGYRAGGHTVTGDGPLPTGRSAITDVATPPGGGNKTSPTRRVLESAMGLNN